MFPIINVWGFFSDNGSFSLTFSHVLPVSLFKSNSSSASIGTCKFLVSWIATVTGGKQRWLWHEEKHWYSSGRVSMVRLEISPSSRVSPSSATHLICSSVSYFSPSSPAGHCMFFQSCYDGNVCDLPLLAHLQLCISHLAARFPFQHNSQESSDCRQSYPGVENGPFCLCAGCGLVQAALTGSLIGQVMLSLLLLGLAAAPQIGRKAGRTRDLRYKLLLYSQPVKNLISSGNNKEIPRS